MSRRKTRFPGVSRYESRRGRKYDTFQARIYDSSRDSKQLSVGTFPTAKEAYEAKKAAELEREACSNNGGLPATHREYFEIWLDLHPRPTEASARSYRSTIKRFLMEFGDVPLGEISRREARGWANRVPGGSVKAAKAMLSDAFDDELVSSNPFTKLKLTRSKGRRNQEPPSLQEIEEVLRVAVAARLTFSEEISRIILFGFGCALRPNEIGALRWKDIDLANHSVSVREAINSEGELGDPKKGVKSLIALTPLGERALPDKPDNPYDPEEFVFEGPNGALLTTPMISGSWGKMRKLYKKTTGSSRFERVSLYLTLRHGGAAHMRNVVGIRPDDVEMQLRHSGPSLLDLYTHPKSRPSIDRILEAWSEYESETSGTKE